MNPTNPMTPCIICHKQNDTSSYRTLYNLYQFLRSKHIPDIDDPQAFTYDWHINSHCNYSLPCPKLRQNDNQVEMLGYKLNKKLNYIARSNDPKLLHETLRYLRGYFPKVYNDLERNYYINEKETEVTT